MTFAIVHLGAVFGAIGTVAALAAVAIDNYAEYYARKHGRPRP